MEDDRRVHILDGDGEGVVGGHAPGTGIPGKTEFPETWDDDQIIANLEDVARNPQTVVELQNNGRWRVQGIRDGVTIEVIVLPDGRVWTAYPLSGPGVIINPE